MKEPDENTFWHLLWSNQAAILSALLTAQALLPVWKGIVPEQVFLVAGAVLATAIPILRKLPQRKVQEKVERERQRQIVETDMRRIDRERARARQTPRPFSEESARQRAREMSGGGTTGGPRRDMRNTTTDDVTRTAAVTSTAGMSSSDCGSSSSTDSGSSTSSCDSGSSF